MLQKLCNNEMIAPIISQQWIELVEQVYIKHVEHLFLDGVHFGVLFGFMKSQQLDQY